MTLRSLMQSNYWRVEMAWSDSNPRYFGKFRSRTEAEKWIEEHQRALSDSAKERVVADHRLWPATTCHCSPQKGGLRVTNSSN